MGQSLRSGFVVDPLGAAGPPVVDSLPFQGTADRLLDRVLVLDQLVEERLVDGTVLRVNVEFDRPVVLPDHVVRPVSSNGTGNRNKDCHIIGPSMSSRLRRMRLDAIRLSGGVDPLVSTVLHKPSPQNPRIRKMTSGTPSPAALLAWIFLIARSLRTARLSSSNQRPQSQSPGYRETQ